MGWAWLIAVVGALPGGEAPTAAFPPPVYTRQATFSIPFQVARAAAPTQDPVEVQLYVSSDRGAQWRLAGRVEPRQGRFTFRAAGDGEYWFFLRTLDRAGQLRPDGSPTAGLVVVVDSMPPRLDLSARLVDGGRIVTQWRIEDRTLATECLRLQYRADPMHGWQTVAIDPRGGGNGAVRTGEASWMAPVASGRVEIRAESSDRAGNPAVSHAQVELGSTRSAQLPPGSGLAPDPFLAAQERQDAAGRSSGDWQPAGRLGGLPATAARSPSESATNGPISIQINPALRQQYGAGRIPGAAMPSLPPGTTPRMVNMPAFELEYQVDAIGPSGIAKVELWGTRDGGRNWSSFGLDHDRQSPMLVTVKEEGVYGFVVAVENGVGLGGGPPPAGRAPDIWIGVDLSKPVLQFTAVQQGAGQEAGQLLLRWTAEDWQLCLRPIALYYSESAAGPWNPIVVGVENTGEYRWTIDQRIPERLFLRIEARDEAGNLGIAETAKPVVLDRLRPSVRIQDVRPIGQRVPELLPP